MEVKVFKPKTPNEEVKYLGKLLTETDIDKNMTHGYNIMWKKHLNGKKAKVRLLIGWYTVRLLVQYDLDGKRYTIDGLGYSGGLFLKQYG